jgi:hypothetical protein
MNNLWIIHSAVIVVGFVLALGFLPGLNISLSDLETAAVSTQVVSNLFIKTLISTASWATSKTPLQIILGKQNKLIESLR